MSRLTDKITKLRLKVLEQGANLIAYESLAEEFVRLRADMLPLLEAAKSDHEKVHQYSDIPKVKNGVTCKVCDLIKAREIGVWNDSIKVRGSGSGI